MNAITIEAQYLRFANPSAMNNLKAKMSNK